MRRRLAGFDAVEHLLSDLPKEMEHWHALAQDQYLEVRTLLSGYLLSSQGDRMLMAHSVEGRFPFLDTELVELANSLPPHYKLRRLDEKHVLKRASEGLVPQAIIRRPKQPYRAPDALSFTAPTRPEWVDEVLAESSVREVGVFDPGAVSTLWAKCRERQTAPLSNADNMALVGVLSTQLLHRQLIQRVCQSPPVGVRISMDRLSKRGVS
jgi:asparagine synthase (glutamine-hydrolysing)